MTPQEIDAFLKEPNITELATVRPDGSPHVATVWYLYDGENVSVLASSSAVKVRNIRTEPRVSLSIATHEEPYKYVLVNGVATESYEGIPELLLTMAVHYKGDEEGKLYAERVIKEMDFCILTITPSNVISWTEGD